MVNYCLKFLLIVLLGMSMMQPIEAREVMNLDGTWNIAEGSMDTMPEQFAYKVPVPGLVDMSSPDFFEVGIPSERREAFWYQRTFRIDGEIPPVALLKVHKAKYGTKVFLNGNHVGVHMPCFTPGYFDLKPHLKGNGQPNELVIRVGAHLESVPKSQPNGWDFEKYKYIPGIYDSVEVILTGNPRIVNIQTAPQIESETVRIQAEIHNAEEKNHSVSLQYEIWDKQSGSLAARGAVPTQSVASQSTNVFDFTAKIPGCKLWSPDNPYLYEVILRTNNDTCRTRFAMRSFTFNAETGQAILNGKPYYLRGTNVCIYRFFEDAERGALPWNKEWVRTLHQKFKDMNWNSIRYCIGFPPEFWYDIADELGILIQDEFPIWSLGEWPEELKAEAIAEEYTEWMRERWNHPCVVMWDAQNESVTEETGKAINMVRDLDLSNRCWDNGWGLPQGPNDTLESHPYYFSKSWHEVKPVSLKEFSQRDGEPRVRENQDEYKRPYIINEYAWLWINRDGSPTCLTENVYISLLGEESTVEQRRDIYARYIAAQTEFWRHHRKCAGILHFCGLGYSRPGGIERPAAGATSDHFLDVAHLAWEPHYVRYVRDSFAPVGIMLDYWDETPTEKTLDVPVSLINDLHTEWQGMVRVRLEHNDQTLLELSERCTVEPLGKERVSFSVSLPDQPGTYTLIAEYGEGKERVQSVRKLTVK